MQKHEFSSRSRSQLLQKIKSQTYKTDALIIGGGIVGAGLARELSIRGVKHLLVEKNDYASGTSSKSSKLIHGGLRYLEMFDFALVFESLSERHWLLSTHPHLVSPLEFNLPIYKKAHAPAGARSSGLLGMGLWLYDALSLFRTPFFHGKRSSSEMAKLFPELKQEGLSGGYFYADAMMLDDELVLETLYDAVVHGSEAVNYTEVVHVGKKQSEYYPLTLKDSFTGETFLVEAKEVISCVGPWTEIFGKHTPSGAERKLKPSKGVHVIVPWSSFPVKKCLVMYAEDGRIIFAIPRLDLGRGAEVVIIGTTDSPEKHDPSTVEANDQDIAYLRKVVKQYFPKFTLDEKQILATFAGVRPLLDSGESSEAKTSREHEIWRNHDGIVFMAGGKYTTFRKISQEIADFVFPISKNVRKKFNQKSKEQLSTPQEYQQRLKGKVIWGKYTDEWIRFKIRHHAPCTLADLIFRRTPLWFGGKENVKNILDEVFQIGVEEKLFDPSQEKIEKDQVLRLF